MEAGTRDFVVKRLFSLSGVVPIAAFALLHFYNMSYSLRGPEAFDRHMEALRGLPYMTAFEWVFIYLPLLFHGAVGILITMGMTPGTARYPYLNNWRYMLQRLSGIGVALFIGAHVYKVKFEPWMHGAVVDFEHMREGLTEPLTLAVYLLGIVGTSYHLANGLWTFGITWGIWRGERSQRVASGLCVAFGVVVLAVALNSIAGFLGTGVGAAGAEAARPA